MPISAQLLGDDEEVLVDVHPHWVFLVAPVLVTVVAVAVAATVTTRFPNAPVGVAWVLVVMVAVPAIWLVARVVRWLSISTVVTSTRVLLRRGVFRRDVAQLRLQRVVEVHSTQSIFERLVGSGRLVFDVEGDDGPIVVDDVRRPRALQRVISVQLGNLDARWAPGPVHPPAGQPSGASHDRPITRRPVSSPPGAPRDLAPGDETPPHGVAVTARDEVTAPSGPPAAPDSGAPAPSVHQQLIELDDLRRRGIVTDAEFETKKADLLSRL